MNQKDIPGFEGLYAVTDDGRVWSYRRKIFLKPGLDRYGYLIVNLYKDKKGKTTLVHQLVAKAFIPNPENKPQINHINEIKTDNRVENLQWVTAKENVNHGTRNKRASNAASKPVYCVELDTVYKNTAEAAKALRVSVTSVGYCCTGRQDNVIGYHLRYADKEEKAKIPRKSTKKAIYCVELDRVFESQTAAAKELGLSNTCISHCCNGKLKTTGGYHFHFATEDEIKQMKLNEKLDELTALVIKDIELEKVGIDYRVPDIELGVNCVIPQMLESAC